jgi:hypothetical protein
LNGVLPDDLLEDNVLAEVIQTALGRRHLAHQLIYVERSQNDVFIWKLMPMLFAILTCNLIFEDGSQSAYGGFENNGHCITSTLVSLTRCIMLTIEESSTDPRKDIVDMYMSYIKVKVLKLIG